MFCYVLLRAFASVDDTATRDVKETASIDNQPRKFTCLPGCLFMIALIIPHAKRIVQPKKLLTFASAASTLISRVTVAKFESMMMIRRFKGGEFYDNCTKKYDARCAKQWNSSIKQPWSIGEGVPIPSGVAAWMMVHPGVFFCPFASPQRTVLPRSEHIPAFFTGNFS